MLITPRIAATLRGEGVEAICIVETWAESSSTGRILMRGRIIGDPPGLPDGPYTVEFAGYKLPTRKWAGEWELNFLPSDLWRRKAA